MAIYPYRASTDIFRPFFDEMFSSSSEGARSGSLMRAPLADVVETESDIRVVAEMPGLTPADLQIDIENNVLTIAGEKQEDRRESDRKSTWHLAERRYGRFSRSFVLPRDVDQEGISASFENGILTVVIPKSERARRRRIDIMGDGGRKKVEAGVS